MIIGISGKIGHGKDTVSDMVQLLSSYPWKTKKFAGKLKQMTCLFTGCTLEQLEDQEFKKTLIGPQWGDLTYRTMMIRIGTEAMRDNVHLDTWVNALFADYNPKKDFWIVTDLRFINEALAIQSRGGILLRVNRPGVPSIDHISETMLDDFTGFDEVLVNDSTLDDLNDKVARVLFNKIYVKLEKNKSLY